MKYKSVQEALDNFPAIAADPTFPLTVTIRRVDYDQWLIDLEEVKSARGLSKPDVDRSQREWRDDTVFGPF